MYKRKLSLGIVVLALLTLIAGACGRVAEDTVTLKDTAWVLESYGAQGNLQAVLEGTEITAKFDRTEDRVHGSSGCNTYGGDYHISGSELSIPALEYTRPRSLSRIPRVRSRISPPSRHRPIWRGAACQGGGHG